MAKIILTGDGQSFPLEDEIARDDDLLKSVVKSVSPAYTNPTFRRETKDGELIVHVSKQAGTKGGGALEVLIAAPEERGPVEIMRERMDKMARRRELTVDTALKMEREVRDALAAGHDERMLLIHAFNTMALSEQVEADYVPTGF